jgi:hypothetical protein
MSVTDEELTLNYFVLTKAYIEDNGQVFDANNFRITQGTGKPFFSRWDYKILTQPTEAQLKSKDLVAAISKRELERRKKVCLTLQIFTTSERDSFTFDKGCLIFNNTSSRVQIFDGTTWSDL